MRKCLKIVISTGRKQQFAQSIGPLESEKTWRIFQTLFLRQSTCKKLKIFRVRWIRVQLVQKRRDDYWSEFRKNRIYHIAKSLDPNTGCEVKQNNFESELVVARLAEREKEITKLHGQIYELMQKPKIGSARMGGGGGGG